MLNSTNSMTPTAMLILRWIRADTSKWDHGYTTGYLHAITLPDWERTYLENVHRARLNGVSA